MRYAQRRFWLRTWTALRRRVSLLEDKADDQTIDHDLRAGVEMRGTYLWVLMFAILIASIGLNVNSTAVIIGAMLISPLMGPILGVGYGVGILDIDLVRRALKNLGIAVAIALTTSALYFWVSPLTVAASELQARTTPTIWDVLVALFGGFAGIIGVTRREKSNIIPGVAIATALMPPLCTAGFGVARGDWSFMGGAFFLFAINCVFIAISAGVVCRAFHLRQRRYLDTAVARRVRLYVALVVTLTLVPSVYFAYRMVGQELFRARAAAFVEAEFGGLPSHVTQTVVSAPARRIEITLVGDYVAPEQLAAIRGRLERHGLAGAQVLVHQAADRAVDVTQLKSSLLGDLYAQSQQTIEKKDQAIVALRAERDALVADRESLRALARELGVLYPQLQNVVVAEGWLAPSGADATPRRGVLIHAQTLRRLPSAEIGKVRAWVQVRIPSARVEMWVDTLPAGCAGVQNCERK